MTRHAIFKLGMMGAVAAVGALACFWLSENKAYHLANGIKVIPREVPQDDLAQALDVRIWKFDVVMPDDRYFCLFNLDQYSHGKLIHQLGGGGFQPSKFGNQVTLSLTPLNGDFTHARQVRSVLQINTGSGVSGYFPNPLLNRGGFADGISVNTLENRVYLMGGGKQAMAPAGINDTDIALDIEPGARVPVK